MALEITLLGPPRVARDGESVVFETRKATALLAHLALAEHPRSREALCELLYPDQPADRARGALRRTLSTLRKGVGEEWVEVAGDSIALVRGPGLDVDVERFRALGVDGAPPEHLSEAAALFAGGFLEGFSLPDSPEFDDWQTAVAGALERELALILRRLVQALTARGDFGEAIPRARRWLELDPLHEPAHRELIRLYALSGDRAAALDQYRTCVRMLSQELGVAPLEETTLLYAQLNDGSLSPPARPNDLAMGVGVDAELPVGVVTLLFSDIEGSTRLLQTVGEAYGEFLADHHRLLRAVWLMHHGVEFGTEGDAFFVAFAEPAEAVEAAIAAQHVLAAHDWPQGGRVRVRIGIHTGSPHVRDRDYWGIDVHYAARLSGAANGGQVLLSESTALLVNVPLEDLGEHAVKDFPAPRRIFHLPVGGQRSECFPPPRTLRAGRTNLPAQVSSFVGRERELAELRALVSRARVVTLTGSGGVGKTRLALQVGAELLDGSGDGVWFVDLAPLAHSALVGTTVANVLQVPERPGRPLLDTLVDALRDRSLLVVLDNCEHVIMAAAELVDGLARGCPGLVVLATSREPLGVSGEHVYRVPSLSVPGEVNGDRMLLEGSEAVRLFVERAALQRPGFALDDDNAALVGRVCRRLDGIPLAIELATARLRSLSIGDLDARLDRRLQLLTGGSRAALPRQQTLRALIDWSYELLSEPERTVLARLSVFAGGCDLEAAEHVCEGAEVDRLGVLDLLGTLVDKSVVQADDSAGSVRYHLLETVREYAAAKLVERGQADARSVRKAHRDYYLSLAEAAEPNLIGRDQLAWLDRVETEHDNLRAALAELLEDPDPEPGLRMATALGEFRSIRGLGAENAAALDAVLSRPDAGEPGLVRGRALIAAGRNLAQNMGDYLGAIACCEQALAIARGESADDRLAAEALEVMSAAHWRRGDLAASLALADEGLALARPIAGAHLVARLNYRRGTALDSIGQDGRAALEEAADLFREAGDRDGASTATHAVGCYELAAGDIRSARIHFEEALAIARQLGSSRSVVIGLINLGLAAHLEGDDPTAQGLLAEALDGARRLGDRECVLYTLLDLALTATSTGAHEEAAQLHGAVDELLDQLGEQFEVLEARLRAADHEQLKAKLGTSRFDAATRAGRALSLKDAIRSGLALATPQRSAPGES